MARIAGPCRPYNHFKEKEEERIVGEKYKSKLPIKSHALKSLYSTKMHLIPPATDMEMFLEHLSVPLGLRDFHKPVRQPCKMGDANATGLCLETRPGSTSNLLRDVG